MERPSWAPSDVDIETPSIARVYDYWVGGTHNFEVDRAVARQVEEANPALPKTFRANRAFLRRAGRELAGLGIRQFLDVGSGIPAEHNVHDAVFAAAPDSKVVYTDIDPVAVAHGRAILADEPRAAIFQGDLYKPKDIFEAPDTVRLIDFDQPVGLILGAVLHFVPEENDPLALIRQFTDRLVPGSYLVLSHAGADEVPQAAPNVAKSYGGAVSEVIWRSTEQFTALFEGFQLIDPGVTPVTVWRPDADADVDGLGAGAPMLAGAALKPAV
ncbi:SAM-dependent methyltransferase [Streptomyces sp. SPB162]|uniref:SAM-dependent methyltransferase n=1 Tax=Streptomyces sp. SPB162 TaxID=2940560 RepID=UPI0024050B8C|nr:SAM-dependent methyltransferase [Streptomyces sp. SPB162]MDF9816829.1 SAM-dependent methyltransferase [Streptomyces sp. SPB162]